MPATSDLHKGECSAGCRCLIYGIFVLHTRTHAHCIPLPPPSISQPPLSPKPTPFSVLFYFAMFHTRITFFWFKYRLNGRKKEKNNKNIKNYLLIWTRAEPVLLFFLSSFTFKFVIVHPLGVCGGSVWVFVD